jgi:hypothetical protein
MGCLVGSPARFPAAADAVKWVQSAPSRARDTESSTCVAGFNDLPNRLPPPGKDVPPFTITGLLTWYYGSLVLPLCVSDPGVGGGAP